MKNLSEEFLVKLGERLGESVIIVEGKKDKKALAMLGAENVIDISGKQLIEVVEMVRKRKRGVIILTDFDRKGREMNKKLIYLLSKYKIKVDRKLRHDFMMMGFNKIEDMNKLKGEDDYYVKACTRFYKILNKGKVHRKWDRRKTRRYRSDFRPE